MNQHPKIQLKLNLIKDDCKKQAKFNSQNSKNEQFVYDQQNQQLSEKVFKQMKIDHFSQICSDVFDEFLYASGQVVSNNEQLLQEMGITHVINCAGNVCKNFKSPNLTYKTYYLKDSKSENIECVFYDAIFFIEEAKQKKGKVLVHCIQGVSRSISIILAYLIFKYQKTYEDGFSIVKQRRGVANPNIGFTVQLIMFYKRLYEPVSGTKIYLICSFQIEQPYFIVAKLIMDNQKCQLDQRGVFLFQCSDIIYIWIGSKCGQHRKSGSLDYAQYYLKILQEYEQGPENVKIIEQGQEDYKFWKDIELEQHQPIQVKEWDTVLQNIDQTTSERREIITSEETKQFRNNGITKISEQQEMMLSNKPTLFFYPNSREGIKVFDYEDLLEETLCVLCQDDSDRVIFVWKNTESIETQSEELFIKQVKQYFWGNEEMEYKQFQEKINEESELFMQFFN